MRVLIAIGLFLFLAGCSQVNIDDYAGTEPAFDPTRFFSGTLSAHGVIKDRSGKVLRHFNAEIIGSWNEGVGTLDETFHYSDGESEKRIWTLVPAGEDRWTATAGDVIGSADVRTAGNAMHLRYTLRVPYKDGTLDLSMDDWMYRVDENIVINHTEMRKFGFKVGEVVLTIIRHPPP